MAKKTTTKKAAKKVVAKTALKKVAAKKTVSKATTSLALQKVPAKKIVTKKVVTKKASTKPATKKAPPAKRVVKTSIIARVDVGFGNSLYIRGEGAGLSWDKGVQLDNVSPYEWAFSTTKAKGDITFKFLINDEIWAEGDNFAVALGGTSISSPVFAW